jgi:hypothetical protein
MRNIVVKPKKRTFSYVNKYPEKKIIKYLNKLKDVKMSVIPKQIRTRLTFL